MITLAFDVYGTLINTYGMVDLLKRYIGEDKAMAFASTWRDKQLEYSFRRSMMGQYEPFYVCTSEALKYCIEFYQVEITRDQYYSLLKRYQILPVYKDVVTTLKALYKQPGIRLFALTNGPGEEVERLFEDNQINSYFEDIVSIDEIKIYKPDPAVYEHFLNRANTDKSSSWLISGNSFDVLGASSVGMHSVWIRRYDQQIADPWSIKAENTIHQLSDLPGILPI